MGEEEEEEEGDDAAAVVVAAAAEEEEEGPERRCRCKSGSSRGALGARVVPAPARCSPHARALPAGARAFPPSRSPRPGRFRCRSVRPWRRCLRRQELHAVFLSPYRRGPRR